MGLLPDRHGREKLPSQMWPLPLTDAEHGETFYTVFGVVLTLALVGLLLWSVLAYGVSYGQP